MYKAQLKQKFLEANNQHKDEVRQFRLGIGQLFEAALPKCLLYKQERPQYHYLIQNGNTEQSLDSNSDGKDNKKESTSTTTSTPCRRNKRHCWTKLILIGALVVLESNNKNKNNNNSNIMGIICPSSSSLGVYRLGVPLSNAEKSRCSSKSV